MSKEKLAITGVINLVLLVKSIMYCSGKVSSGLAGCHDSRVFLCWQLPLSTVCVVKVDSVQAWLVMFKPVVGNFFFIMCSFLCVSEQ